MSRGLDSSSEANSSCYLRSDVWSHLEYRLVSSAPDNIIRWCWPVAEACNFIKKETLAQKFPCEFCEVSENTVLRECLWATAFVVAYLQFRRLICFYDRRSIDAVFSRRGLFLMHSMFSHVFFLNHHSSWMVVTEAVCNIHLFCYSFHLQLKVTFLYTFWCIIFLLCMFCVVNASSKCARPWCPFFTTIQLLKSSAAGNFVVRS